MLRTVALVLFGVAIVVAGGVAAPVPKHLAKAPEGDKAKLQGKWRIESCRMGDEDLLAQLLAAAPEQGIRLVIEFRGDQALVTTTIGGTSRESTATVKYDLAKKQLSMTSQKDHWRGYAFDGDKLIMAVHADGGAADPLKPGKNDIVTVLARIKQ